MTLAGLAGFFFTFVSFVLCFSYATERAVRVEQRGGRDCAQNVLAPAEKIFGHSLNGMKTH